MDLLDYIALDFIREGEKKTGRRPLLKQISRVVGMNIDSVAKRLKRMEGMRVLAPRKNITPKRKPPSPARQAKWAAGEKRRRAAKARQAENVAEK